VSLFGRRPRPVAGITPAELRRLSPRDRRAYLATYQVSARDWTPAQLAQMEKLADAVRSNRRSR
jgi:hypothetical protein